MSTGKFTASQCFGFFMSLYSSTYVWCYMSSFEWGNMLWSMLLLHDVMCCMTSRCDVFLHGVYLVEAIVVFQDLVV